MGGGSPKIISSAPDTTSDRDFHYPPSPLPSSSDGFASLRDRIFEKVSDESLDSIHSRRKCRIYEEIMQSYQYDSMQERKEMLIEFLEDAKNEILSYKPGSWIEEVGGLNRSAYDIPRTTTLLLIGLKGSGKSSLVNRISRVFEDDEFSSDRAQVFCNQSGDGTCFLQEYMIPRDSASFSLYDTRSLSENPSENFKVLKNWMTEGVQHGQMVIRDSDSAAVRKIIKTKARHILPCHSEKKMVNFVIFVVDGISVQKSMTDGKSAQYTSLLAETFNCPYLTFRDDKPVVLVTHVDELTLSDRARIRMYLGDLLGIPPATQIFDIQDKCDLSSKLTIVKMLRYCLEHADRNLPFEERTLLMGFQAQLLKKTEIVMVILILILILVVIAITKTFARQQPSDVRIDWHKIRHLWMG